jgi:hypothetical protein
MERLILALLESWDHLPPQGQQDAERAPLHRKRRVRKRQEPVLFGLSRTEWRLQCINTLRPCPERSQFLSDHCWFPTLQRPGHRLARLRNTAARARSRLIRCGPTDRHNDPALRLQNSLRRLRDPLRAGTDIVNLPRFRWSVRPLTEATRRLRPASGLCLVRSHARAHGAAGRSVAAGRISQRRPKPLAPHGRTIHMGQSHQFDGFSLTSAYPQ